MREIQLKSEKIQIDRAESCHRHHTFGPTFDPRPCSRRPPSITFSFPQMKVLEICITLICTALHCIVLHFHFHCQFFSCDNFDNKIEKNVKNCKSITWSMLSSSMPSLRPRLSVPLSLACHQLQEDNAG